MAHAACPIASPWVRRIAHFRRTKSAPFARGSSTVCAPPDTSSGSSATSRQDLPVPPPNKIPNQELCFLFRRYELQGCRDIHNGAEGQTSLVASLVYQAYDLAFVLGGRFHASSGPQSSSANYFDDRLSWNSDHFRP